MNMTLQGAKVLLKAGDRPAQLMRLCAHLIENGVDLSQPLRNFVAEELRSASETRESKAPHRQRGTGMFSGRNMAIWVRGLMIRENLSQNKAAEAVAEFLGYGDPSTFKKLERDNRDDAIGFFACVDGDGETDLDQWLPPNLLEVGAKYRGNK